MKKLTITQTRNILSGNRDIDSVEMTNRKVKLKGRDKKNW